MLDWEGGFLKSPSSDRSEAVIEKYNGAFLDKFFGTLYETDFKRASRLQETRIIYLNVRPAGFASGEHFLIRIKVGKHVKNVVDGDCVF